jgi:predicted acylesterase/phospholipase RssA
MKQIILILLFTLTTINCRHKEEALVTVTTHLSLREKPDAKSNIIKKLYNNQKVIIIEETSKYQFIDDVYGQFVKIEDEDGVKGYVFDAYLVTENFASKFREKKICLVLSVGGSDGIAHIGALKAINYLNINPNCIFGNSMGALIGSLYASNPNNSYKETYSDLMESYVQYITELKINEAKTNGILGGMALALINPFLGIAGGLAIAENSANSVDERSIELFESFLNHYFNRATIESLPIEFGTSYYRKNGQGVELVIEKTGNLSSAIIGSISNPYIFNLKDNNKIDPGIDRTSSTPISDTCSTFQPDIIIAINVTGKNSVYDKTIKCKVIEIKLSYIFENEIDVILGKGKEYDSLIKKSFSDTLYQMKDQIKTF